MATSSARHRRSPEHGLISTVASDTGFKATMRQQELESDVPLRVLMIASEWPTEDIPGNVSFIVRQVNFLRRAGIHVEVFVFRGAKNPVNYFKAWARLHGKLRHECYDLIHAQSGQSGLLAWPKHLPLVVTFRGDDILGVNRPSGGHTLAGKVLRQLSRFVARRADAVIAVADHMRKHLPSSVSVNVIPSGLDFESLPLIPQSEARQRLRLPLDGRLVLYVSNPANPRKRCELARQAVEILNERLPAKLIVVWGVPHAEIPVYMCACDVFLFTSSQEGSPNVIKEALACNLPVVSVAVGDVAMRLRGSAGCEVCDDDRPQTIAASLERVLTRQQPTNGREMVRDLDEKLITQKVIGVYRSILKKRLASADRKDASILAARESEARNVTGGID